MHAKKMIHIYTTLADGNINRLSGESSRPRASAYAKRRAMTPHCYNPVKSGTNNFMYT